MRDFNVRLLTTLANGTLLVEMTPEEWQTLGVSAETLDNNTLAILRRSRKLSARTRNALLRGLNAVRPGDDAALLGNFDYFLEAIDTQPRLPFRGIGQDSMAELRRVFSRELTQRRSRRLV